MQISSSQNIASFASNLIDAVAFHNVPQLEWIPGHGDQGLVRIPRQVRHHLNERARFVCMDSVGCEIRFVSSAANIDVYLSATKPEFADHSEIRVFRGNFEVAKHTLTPGTIHHFRLGEPPNFRIVDRRKLQGRGFSPDVYRVCFDRGGTGHLHGIDTHGHDIRPPRPEELPTVNWLAYGSSITNSSLSGYLHTAARLLQVDVQNKGMSGSCQAEPELADWLADHAPWDLITCELGINMRGGFDPDPFRQRITYLLKRLTESKPDKPVVAIDVFPNFYTRAWVDETHQDHIEVQRESAYNQIVQDVVAELDRPNLHHIAGRDILDDFNYLSGDLLHPSEYGQMMMGQRLAEKLAPILGLSSSTSG